MVEPLSFSLAGRLIYDCCKTIIGRAQKAIAFKHEARVLEKRCRLLCDVYDNDVHTNTVDIVIGKAENYHKQKHKFSELEQIIKDCEMWVKKYTSLSGFKKWWLANKGKRKYDYLNEALSREVSRLNFLGSERDKEWKLRFEVLTAAQHREVMEQFDPIREMVGEILLVVRQNGQMGSEAVQQLVARVRSGGLRRVQHELDEAVAKNEVGDDEAQKVFTRLKTDLNASLRSTVEEELVRIASAAAAAAADNKNDDAVGATSGDKGGKETEVNDDGECVSNLARVLSELRMEVNRSATLKKDDQDALMDQLKAVAVSMTEMDRRYERLEMKKHDILQQHQEIMKQQEEATDNNETEKRACDPKLRMRVDQINQELECIDAGFEALCRESLSLQTRRQRLYSWVSSDDITADGDDGRRHQAEEANEIAESIALWHRRMQEGRAKILEALTKTRELSLTAQIHRTWDSYSTGSMASLEKRVRDLRTRWDLAVPYNTTDAIVDFVDGDDGDKKHGDSGGDDDDDSASGEDNDAERHVGIDWPSYEKYFSSAWTHDGSAIPSDVLRAVFRVMVMFRGDGRRVPLTDRHLVDWAAVDQMGVDFDTLVRVHLVERTLDDGARGNHIVHLCKVIVWIIEAAAAKGHDPQRCVGSRKERMAVYDNVYETQHILIGLSRTKNNPHGFPTLMHEVACESTDQRHSQKFYRTTSYELLADTPTRKCWSNEDACKERVTEIVEMHHHVRGCRQWYVPYSRGNTNPSPQPEPKVPVARSTS